MFKILTFLLVTVFISLPAYSDDSRIKNFNSTDTYGELRSSNLGASYSLNELTNNAYRLLCIGMETTDPHCKKNLENLEKYSTFHVSKIIDNNLEITGVNEYNITYTTPGLNVINSNNDLTRTVSGGVIIPQGIATDKIKGVVLLYHSTVASKNNNECGPEADILDGKGYAAIYASQGYIVVFPDYLGYGVDRNEVHPYVIFPQINVLSGIHMLKATRQLLNSLGVSNKSLNLYVTGYSEGGGYALWTSYMLQNNMADLDGTNMHLKATAPMAGPYDLTNIQLPFELSNVTPEVGKNTYNILDVKPITTSVTVNKSVLMPFILTSFAHYNNINCSDVMLTQFCNLKDTDSKYTVFELFEKTDDKLTSGTIGGYLYKQATSMQINPLSDTNNSVEAFIAKPLHSKFIQAIKDSSLVDWKTQSPIALIYLNYDSVVPNLNAINAYKGMTKLSNPNLIKKINIDNYDFTYFYNNSYTPIDHSMGGGMFQVIATLSAFEQFNDN